MEEREKSGWSRGLAGLLAPVTFWLGLFFLVPLLLILIFSFGTSGVYGGITLGFNPGNYLKVFDPWLPAGVLDRLQGWQVAHRPGPARRGPVLDEPADPGLLLGGHPERQRHRQQDLAVSRDNRRARYPHLHPSGSDDGDGLLVSAVYGSAAVCGPREVRHQLEGGGARPRGQPLAHLLAGYVSPEYAGCDRGQHPGVHTVGGRVRHPEPPRRITNGDDGESDPAAVPPGA